MTPSRRLRHAAALIAACAAAALGAATPLAAQAARASRPNLFSTNPIALLFGWAGGEYEREIGAGTTLALGASYFEFYGDDGAGEEDDYFSADLKLRYYPSERAFSGLSLGASAGVMHVTDVIELDPLDQRTESATGPTIGVSLDYGWLLGRRDAVHIGLGVGARRVFYDDDEDAGVDALDVMPHVRFSVGVAF